MVVIYRRSILDLMSKAKTKKSSSKPGRLAKSSKPSKATIAKLAAQVKPPLQPLPFWYGVGLVRQCLKIIKANLESCMILFLLPSLLLTLAALLIGNGKHITNMTVVGGIMGIAGFAWFIISAFAIIPFTILLAKGFKPGVADSYRIGLRCAPRLVGLTILLLLLFAAGLCLFIVPGLIVLRRYGLAYYYIVDYDLGIRDAMDMSSEQTKPVTKAILGMFLVLSVFVLLAVGSNRTLKPYGGILAILFEASYVIAPALFYLELQRRNNAYKEPVELAIED